MCAALAALVLAALAAPVRAQQSPLANATILIIRHAEKPDTGSGLTPAGQARANWYPQYFQTYKIDGKPVHIDYLFAAKDSTGSQRPRLTIEPLSQTLKMPIDTTFKDKNYAGLAAALATHYYGKVILISWHHGEIPALLTALGVDPATLLPGGKWPGKQFGWVLELHFDKNGHPIPAECIRVEEAAPGSS